MRYSVYEVIDNDDDNRVLGYEILDNTTNYIPNSRYDSISELLKAVIQNKDNTSVGHAENFWFNPKTTNPFTEFYPTEDLTTNVLFTIDSLDNIYTEFPEYLI